MYTATFLPRRTWAVYGGWSSQVREESFLSSSVPWLGSGSLLGISIVSIFLISRLICRTLSGLFFLLLHSCLHCLLRGDRIHRQAQNNTRNPKLSDDENDTCVHSCSNQARPHGQLTLLQHDWPTLQPQNHMTSLSYTRRYPSYDHPSIPTAASSRPFSALRLCNGGGGKRVF